MAAEQISVIMTAEQLAAAREAVESGEYATVGEVVREAMRGWLLRRELRDREVAELRRLVQEGIDSGPGQLLDIAEIKAEAARQLAKERREAAE